MGDTARPTPERLGDQEEQAAHLVRTGNGPTVEDEQRLLAEQFGAPDMAGFFTGPETVVDQDDEPEAAVGEGDAPAADTAKGGESA
ncbi:hypothetical protein CQW39_09725 [Streptomyces griseofuscus]|uniref:hypothetical protein n=1 Tax=Streptomyces griseofuscus TaxID=146922 RepID=UPI000F64ECC9|nr:hypothetical protein [Streptomyces griseofuscus]RRQ79411.1 hypothetical protein CQW39_09725 [Streptomyces griseofuscus]